MISPSPVFIIHKPSLGLREVPQKIWAQSVQPFWRLLDTNKQTNKRTYRQAKFMYRFCPTPPYTDTIFSVLLLLILVLSFPSYSSLSQYNLFRPPPPIPVLSFPSYYHIPTQSFLSYSCLSQYTIFFSYSSLSQYILFRPTPQENYVY